jgi:hypothetical protein
LEFVAQGTKRGANGVRAKNSGETAQTEGVFHFLKHSPDFQFLI